MSNKPFMRGKGSNTNYTKSNTKKSKSKYSYTRAEYNELVKNGDFLDKTTYDDAFARDKRRIDLEGKLDRKLIKDKDTCVANDVWIETDVFSKFSSQKAYLEKLEAKEFIIDELMSGELDEKYGSVKCDKKTVDLYFSKFKTIIPDGYDFLEDADRKAINNKQAQFIDSFINDKISTLKSEEARNKFIAECSMALDRYDTYEYDLMTDQYAAMFLNAYESPVSDEFVKNYRQDHPDESSELTDHDIKMYAAQESRAQILESILESDLDDNQKVYRIGITTDSYDKFSALMEDREGYKEYPLNKPVAEAKAEAELQKKAKAEAEAKKKANEKVDKNHPCASERNRQIASNAMIAAGCGLFAYSVHNTIQHGMLNHYNTLTKEAKEKERELQARTPQNAKDFGSTFSNAYTRIMSRQAVEQAEHRAEKMHKRIEHRQAMMKKAFNIVNVARNLVRTNADADVIALANSGDPATHKSAISNLNDISNQAKLDQAESNVTYDSPTNSSVTDQTETDGKSIGENDKHVRVKKPDDEQIPGQSTLDEFYDFNKDKDKDLSASVPNM